MKNYITDDSLLAATLNIILEEFPLISYVNGNKHKPYFSFKASKELEETVIKFYEESLVVEPKKLTNTRLILITPPTDYEDF